MAKEKLFWLGEGVFNVDGKDYGVETPLPVGKIKEDDLRKMKADGRIGEKITPVTEGLVDENAALSETIVANALEFDKKIKELEAVVSSQKAIITEFEEKKAAHIKAKTKGKKGGKK